MNFLGDTPFDELKDENAILNFIFSNSSISFAPPSRDARDVSRFESDLAVHKAWTLREAAAVTAAETDKLEDAKVMLDDLCTEAPERASAFNNRAQVRRLGGDLEGAKTDLDAAITLARAWLDVHAGTDHPLVEFHNKTLSNALTQRAAYFNATKGDAAAEAVDLAAAAKLGSQIAKMITTKSNPYATMCHAAVTKMMDELPQAGAAGQGAGPAGEGSEPSGSACSGPDAASS